MRDRAGAVPGARVARRRWWVSGRVQGVGFRWWVLRHARRLGLAGYARNLLDGRVEVAACGDERAIAELAGLLSKGPAEARVEVVEETDFPHDHERCNDFSVS